jgi:hypothetical protein
MRCHVLPEPVLCIRELHAVRLGERLQLHSGRRDSEPASLLLRLGARSARTPRSDVGRAGKDSGRYPHARTFVICSRI